MKAKIVARIGKEAATALLEARMRRRRRMCLKEDEESNSGLVDSCNEAWVSSFTNLNSFFLIPCRILRKGISHAKNLITRMPDSSCCISLTLLSVKTILLVLATYERFTIQLCTGMPMRKRENPARALGPKLTRSIMRAMTIWAIEVHAMCASPELRSIRETVGKHGISHNKDATGMKLTVRSDMCK